MRNAHSRIRITLFALLALASTAAGAQAYVAELAAVTGCRLISSVEASTGYGKRNNWMSDAKYAVLREAEKINADRVVIKDYTPIGSFNGVAKADAYSCE